MSKYLKNIFCVLLTLTVLVSTSSSVVVSRSCSTSGKTKSSSLQTNGCCSSKKAAQSKDCCKIEKHSVEDDFLVSAHAFQFKSPALVLYVLPEFYINPEREKTLGSIPLFAFRSPPFKSGKDIHILIQSFLI